MRSIQFGIIGCGMMGREFAGAVSRWCHLTKTDARPVVTAICNRTLSNDRIGWFTHHFPTISQVTQDYREIVANPKVDAVYCAVPHNLHEEVYCAVLNAGKHLLGEKPFGIDLASNETIMRCIESHPDCTVRCASQFIYYPAAQRILRMVSDGALGRIIEFESGFLHSSDLDPAKPINWKRKPGINGEYGVLGDLGTHVAFLPARLGWRVRNTRAICSNIVSERPDAHGQLTPCDTWDNATLLSEVFDPRTQSTFPWLFKAARIMPGERNTWYVSVHGTLASARFSLKNPKRLELLEYAGGEQRWQQIDMGFETPYATITGGIFEFGATDAFLQLVAAFVHEIVHGAPVSIEAACPSPLEMNAAHRLFSAALRSHSDKTTVDLDNTLPRDLR
ncbi:MAG: oxidoreductase [Candidatus Hydrogenedentota bacterium]